MNDKFNILTRNKGFYTLLFSIGIIMFFLAPKAAVNVDEQLHYPHAKNVVNWYFTGGKDVSCLNTPVSNLKYYGQSPDNFTALVNRKFQIENEFLTRHFTGAVFFWLLLLFSGLLAFQITGSWFAASITVLILVFMPQVSGHAFGNLKDIPFATGYIASIYFLFRFIKQMPKPSWSSALYLSFAIAFTNSVRIGGLILFFYLALFCAIFIIYKPFLLKHFFTTKSLIVRLSGQATIILAIGWFAGLLFWPYALQDVILNPLESLRVMQHYKVGIRQVFDGNLLWSTDLPWYYLPKWLFISTPEFVLLGMVIFTIFFVFNTPVNGRSKKKYSFNIYESFIIFTSLFPLIYVIVIHSNLYSGLRQMIFIFPGIAVLASIGIVKLLNSDFDRKVKNMVATLFFCLMALPLYHQIKTFPVDYVYFNSISGGNRRAWSNYEYDYYFHGIKKPAAELVKLVENENVIVASNCNLSNYFSYSPNITFHYTRFLERSSENWDYGLFGINYIHPCLLKNGKWIPSNVLKIWYHKGNPVVVLVKRGSKKDFWGMEKLNKGYFAEADSLLSMALNEDPNNVWLTAQLAKASLLIQKNEKSLNYIRAGQEIYPKYEPLSLLEAELLFNEQKLAESDAVLLNLLRFNSTYKPGLKLKERIEQQLKINNIEQ